MLMSYVKLLVHSVWHHKIKSQKRTSFGGLSQRFLSFKVYFFDYGKLINQFEEIFVKEVYSVTGLTREVLIIDCGSNIGMSVLYFHWKYPQAKILAFEPDPGAFNLLNHNIQANGVSVCTLYQIALADYSGIGKLSSPYPEHGSLNNSLVKDYGHSVEARVTRLSDFILGEVDLLKIDTEGSEAEILNDLLQTSSLFKIHQMLVEFHPMLMRGLVSTYVQKLEDAGLLLHKDSSRPSALNGNVLLYFRQAR